MDTSNNLKYIKCSIGDTVLCYRGIWAKSLWSRTKGLMLKKSLGSDGDIDGMLIDYCNSVHTFFMRFSLDLVFISKENKVVKILLNKRPWRMTWFYFKAVKVLELPVGCADRIMLDDKIEVEYV